VGSAFWVLVWLLKDKFERFQLLDFIVRMKQAIFISYGVLDSIVANFLFVRCSSLSPEETPCSDHGPGRHKEFYGMLITFVLQLLLSWVSVALLLSPFSSAKGGRFDRDARSSRAELKYIKWWLVYDGNLTLAVTGFVVYFFIKTRLDWDGGPPPEDLKIVGHMAHHDWFEVRLCNLPPV
jgi:hypothetical protein